MQGQAVGNPSVFARVLSAEYMDSPRLLGLVVSGHLHIIPVLELKDLVVHDHLHHTLAIVFRYLIRHRIEVGLRDACILLGYRLCPDRRQAIGRRGNRNVIRTAIMKQQAARVSNAAVSGFIMLELYQPGSLKRAAPANDRWRQIARGQHGGLRPILPPPSTGAGEPRD